MENQQGPTLSQMLKHAGKHIVTDLKKSSLYLKAQKRASPCLKRDSPTLNSVVGQRRPSPTLDAILGHRSASPTVNTYASNSVTASPTLENILNANSASPIVVDHDILSQDRKSPSVDMGTNDHAPSEDSQADQSYTTFLTSYTMINSPETVSNFSVNNQNKVSSLGHSVSKLKCEQVKPSSLRRSRRSLAVAAPVDADVDIKPDISTITVSRHTGDSKSAVSNGIQSVGSIRQNRPILSAMLFGSPKSLQDNNRNNGSTVSMTNKNINTPASGKSRLADSRPILSSLLFGEKKPDTPLKPTVKPEIVNSSSAPGEDGVFVAANIDQIIAGMLNYGKGVSGFKESSSPSSYTQTSASALLSNIAKLSTISQAVGNASSSGILQPLKRTVNDDSLVSKAKKKTSSKKDTTSEKPEKPKKTKRKKKKIQQDADGNFLYTSITGLPTNEVIYNKDDESEMSGKDTGSAFPMQLIRNTFCTDTGSAWPHLPGSLLQYEKDTVVDEKSSAKLVTDTNHQTGEITVKPKKVYYYPDKKPRYCIECGKRYVSAKRLEMHVKAHSIEKHSKCGVCLDVFKEIPELQDHMKTHSGHSSCTNKLYMCAICDKRLYAPSQLEVHIRSHTGAKPFPCPICGRGFSHTWILKSHIRMHSREEHHKCKICGRKFCHENILLKHMGKHATEKLTTCPYCDKMFTQPSNLYRHMRKHTDPRPECKICKQTFSEGDTLKKHMRIHTGQKMTMCPTCGKRFSSSGYLKTHMALHTGDKKLECSVCSKKFRYQTSLKKHEFIHTGAKPFKCTICGHTVNCSSNLRAHFKRHHPNDVPPCKRIRLKRVTDEEISDSLATIKTEPMEYIEGMEADGESKNTFQLNNQDPREEITPFTPIKTEPCGVSESASTPIKTEPCSDSESASTSKTLRSARKQPRRGSKKPVVTYEEVSDDDDNLSGDEGALQIADTYGVYHDAEGDDHCSDDDGDQETRYVYPDQHIGLELGEIADTSENETGNEYVAFGKNGYSDSDDELETEQSQEIMIEPGELLDNSETEAIDNGMKRGYGKSNDNDSDDDELQIEPGDQLEINVMGGYDETEIVENEGDESEHGLVEFNNDQEIENNDLLEDNDDENCNELLMTNREENVGDIYKDDDNDHSLTDNPADENRNDDLMENRQGQ